MGICHRVAYTFSFLFLPVSCGYVCPFTIYYCHDISTAIISILIALYNRDRNICCCFDVKYVAVEYTFFLYFNGPSYFTIIANKTRPLSPTNFSFLNLCLIPNCVCVTSYRIIIPFYSKAIILCITLKNIVRKNNLSGRSYT